MDCGADMAGADPARVFGFVESEGTGGVGAVGALLHLAGTAGGVVVYGWFSEEVVGEDLLAVG